MTKTYKNQKKKNLLSSMTDGIHLFSLDSPVDDFANDTLLCNKHFRQVVRS